MKPKSSRRHFIKRSGAMALATSAVTSLEEYALLSAEPAPRPAAPAPRTMPTGRIGNVEISRLICGGNLISGYAHSRDLIYVSPLLKHYFTDDKILETWARCEEHGINTMILYPADQRAVALYERYRREGGRIQYLAQINPDKTDLLTPVRQARDAGAAGAFLLGNLGDAWTRDGDVALIGKLIGHIKDHGMISGVAGHELRTVAVVEKAGVAPDFYMKTLHGTNYWSTRRPDQRQEVIDNYNIDNYWCMDPEETIGWMAGLERPWIAYKVLAAGAVHPRAGFQHAFENGADFAAVGMFDFQIAEDVAMAVEVLKATRNRNRDWFA